MTPGVLAGGYAWLGLQSFPTQVPGRRWGSNSPCQTCASAFFSTSALVSFAIPAPPSNDLLLVSDSKRQDRFFSICHSTSIIKHRIGSRSKGIRAKGGEGGCDAGLEGGGAAPQFPGPLHGAPYIEQRKPGAIGGCIALEEVNGGRKKMFLE